MLPGPQSIDGFKMKQKEIDQDIVIKMFDHLKGRVHTANQNGLQSLLKF